MSDQDTFPEEEEERPKDNKQSEHDPGYIQRFLDNLNEKESFQSNLDEELTGDSEPQQPSISDEQKNAQEDMMEAAKRFLIATGQENISFINIIIDSLPPGIDVYPIIHTHLQQALTHLRAMEGHTEEIMAAYAVVHHFLHNDPRTMAILEGGDTPPSSIYSSLNIISGIVHAMKDAIRTHLSVYNAIIIDFANKINKGINNEGDQGTVEGDLGLDG